MTAPKSTDENDPSGPKTPRTTPSSPVKPSSAKSADAARPAGARKVAGPNRGVQRRRASTAKQPPTLLNDFLLGRPSPARVAAEREAARKRRKELEQVKQEMRQAAVLRVQAPGGVRDRVKKWQKANAEAMASADPLAPPTEPSEVNVQVDEESVTEKDRERIKWRQKKPAQPNIIVVTREKGGGSGSEKDREEKPRANSPEKPKANSPEKPKANSPEKPTANSPEKARAISPGKPKANGPAKPTANSPEKARANSPEKARANSPEKPKMNSLAKPKTSGLVKPKTNGPEKPKANCPEKPNTNNQERLRMSNAPKKRVVSDTNWVKNLQKDNMPKSRLPKLKQTAGTPIPKDFLQRTAANPSVAKKVHAWASKVEIPAGPPPKLYSVSRSVGSGYGIRAKPASDESDSKSSKSGSTHIVVEEETSKLVKPKVSPKPKELQKAKEPEKPRESQVDRIRVKPVQEKTLKAEERKESQKPKMPENGGIRVKPVREKAYHDSGIKNRLRSSTPPDEGIRIRPVREKSYHADENRNRTPASTPPGGIRVYPGSVGSRSTSTVRAPSRKSSKDAGARTPGTRRSPSASKRIGSTPANPATPTRPGSRKPSGPRHSTQRRPTPKSVAETRTTITDTTGTGTTITGTTQTGTSGTGTTQTGTSGTGTTQTGTTVTGTTQTGTTVTEEVSDSDSWISGSDEESDRPSTALPSRLAEIPVGYSAFSVLDLSSGAKRQNSRRAKAQRQSSFKGATSVLKRVLTEGKKMVSEKVDPPKPVVNQPPSIETWLKGTVDPFVEATPKVEAEPQPHHRKSVEREWADESKAHQATPLSPKPKPAEAKPAEASPTVSAGKSQEPARPEEHRKEIRKDPRRGEPEEIRKEEKEETTPTSNSLRRSRATRVSASPLMPSTSKRGLKDKIRDAFRGESTGHVYKPPPEYPSCSTIVDLDDEYDDEYDDDYSDRHGSDRQESDRRGPDRHGSGRHGSDRRVSDHQVSDHRGSADRTRSPPLSDEEDSIISSQPPRPKSPLVQSKRRPPTNGHHELSTIASEVDSRGTQETELSSVVSGSTVTETTAFTRSTRTGTDLSRRKSQKPGLKRRLTKHSDLVSVLSLPDDGQAPSRSHSLRSARSVRRTSNNLHSATVESLIREFADDENFYQRELKTLMDGVMPVLLTQVVRGEGRAPEDLFGSPSAERRQEMLSKAVVDMGVVLDKLRNTHKRCPLLDVPRLPQWLESVHAIYNKYLDVWRLGFQGVIVNLAPAMLDDGDSLINAMPRNEDGDVLDEDGERIDVAHLLKRPLVRIKWITKFIQGYRSVTSTEDYEFLASMWEQLQEKARRRHKEETARVVDDDASYTDTSRVRNLQTLEALDNVRIDRYRQVYAKDTFCLDLRHSNGQRLVCQVELISRDNSLYKSDPGDLLIREIGNGGRSWLLFAPVIGGYYSARQGDDAYQLVLMIRGNKNEWYELLTLSADDKEQILEWLEILGNSPVPPPVVKRTSPPSQELAPSPKTSAADVPLGERQPRQQRTSSPSLGIIESLEASLKKPSRYHTRTASLPITPNAGPPPAATSSPSPETAPPRDYYLTSRPPIPGQPHEFRDEGGHQDEGEHHDEGELQDDEDSHPFDESLLPDPLDLKKPSPNSTPYRQDGAPPPPVHRSFSQNAPNLAPPAEPSSNRLKRRQSSPLKHEYHPSDISTDASSSISETDDDYDHYDDNYDNYDEYDDGSVTAESSDDELEEVDIPETVPAISVKQHPRQAPPLSVVSESLESLSPSASASHAGLSQTNATKTPEYVFRSIASISYWDNKYGCWKDLWPDLCSIVTTPGLIEAYPYQRVSASSGGQPEQAEERPLIALDLTPLVMLRNSTVLDLEIRSPVLSYARLYSKVNRIETSFFRFRAPSYQECENLYLAAHRARMDNAKYKALEEETRIRAFGQHQHQQGQQPSLQDGGDGSGRRRWFGRKNSYRASARAPSQSAGSAPSLSSTMSASSFLKKLMRGHQSFNIAGSSVGRSRPGSVGGGVDPSLYGPSTASSSWGAPRSPSVSAAQSGPPGGALTTNNIRIRLHLMVSASKWEDHGNCLLEVARPDRGAGERQNLRKYQGMEKRVVVRTVNKRHPEKEKVVLDVVLGSRCFSRLGSRGVLLNVWEDGGGAEGVGDRGNAGGQVSKWCFQCASVAEAAWIYGLVTQEVAIC
ncbi:hypothetical protein DL762_007840 [Monosporascus cannonballus]|uniref:Uncharacterized protein n=1 Tax=Monosporascus cannonballus TaxID=155416 RepID=A0ABY0GXZ6_9PEZI|nr:hypothetical protein DL763_010832 [Monosporascus cannonballus]RYO80083.1 hypothetical protein DL762_007840 [Monosporascus cannonballus]